MMDRWMDGWRWLICLRVGRPATVVVNTFRWSNHRWGRPVNLWFLFHILTSGFGCVVQVANVLHIE